MAFCCILCQLLHRQLTEGLRCAVSESSPSIDGQAESLFTAAGTCAELDAALQTLRRAAETTVIAPIDHPVDQSSTVSELERQNAELRETKDREIAALTGEVKRLKAAIGQLVGVAATT